MKKTKPMRLLVFSQYFWPEGFPINDICTSLRIQNVDVEVLTGKPNYPQGKLYDGFKAWGLDREVYQGIKVNRVPLWPRGKSGLGLVLNYLSFVISGILFAPWLLRGKSYEAIFVYAPSPILQAIPALFLGWIKRCPVVLWVQDLWPESLSATGYVPNRFVLGLVARIVRSIYRHTDLILVQSPAFEAPVRALAGDRRILYHPNSVVAEFAEAPRIEAPVVEGLAEGFSVVFAGNIGQAQAVGVIVEAAKILKDYNDVRFVVIGDGSARAWLQAETEKSGLKNIYLPGKFPFEAMPGLLQQASALLVTLADRDIFTATIPSKVQAYMATGKPIIACLNGEGARLVEEAGAGLACPAENAEALAQTIVKLYQTSAQQRAAMGANGRDYYRQHFNHEDLVKKLINHFKTVVQKETDTR